MENQKTIGIVGGGSVGKSIAISELPKEVGLPIISDIPASMGSFSGHPYKELELTITDLPDLLPTKIDFDEKEVRNEHQHQLSCAKARKKRKKKK